MNSEIEGGGIATHMWKRLFMTAAVLQFVLSFAASAAAFGGEMTAAFICAWVSLAAAILKYRMPYAVKRWVMIADVGYASVFALGMMISMFATLA